MELTKALRIGIQVASGLACAHEIGLIHRDVKPGNILLDEQGNALLADFGIARDLIPQRPTPAHTQPGMNAVIMGTPQYMAPEQFRGDSLDQRIDIYALGAVLYRLLTGVLPHDAPTPLALLSHRVTDVPDLPSTYNAQIPAVLDRALMQALAIDPGDRYPSANSFARALRNTLPRTQSRHNALPIHALATVDTAKTIKAEKQATLPAIAPHHHTHQQTMQPIVDANLHMEHDAENGLAVPTIHKSELQAVSAPISARLDSATQPMTTLIPQAYSTTLPEEPALFAPLLQARPGVIRHLHKVKSLPTKSKWATLALLMTLLLGGYFLTSHGLSQEYGASSNNTTIGVAVPLHDASSQLSAPTPTNNSQPQKTTPPPHGTNHKHHHHGQGD